MSDLGVVDVSVTPEEKFREYLATKGQRMTRERAIILDEVFSSHEHFDADALVQRVAAREDSRRVSRSTVYRTLTQLEESGLIRKVARQDGRDLFEHDYGYPQHDHFICEKCSKLVEFRNEEISRILERVAAEYGFRMSGHRLEVNGICAECARPPERRHRKLDMI
ncbi:MAG: transcriptional repressor [Planctomycetaceae bacterium]|nr:transcriptional repressor [Planctomycetaceae bacterium]